MKKIYFLLLFVCSSLLSYADGMTATLQHGETMTFYLGNTGFQLAYNDAVDGDIITLSSGQFIEASTIEKSVRIVGAYGMTDSTYTTYIKGKVMVNASNVKFEGLYFQSQLTLGSITNCTFKRCWISSLYQSGTHTNTIIDQCVLKYDEAIKTGVNYAIKNSTINYFGSINSETNVANITNCYIQNFEDKQPYAVYKNNILRFQTYTNNTSIYLYAPSEFYNNYLYCTSTYSSSYGYSPYFYTGCTNIGNTLSGKLLDKNEHFPDTASFNLKGGDGTPIGMNGGEGYNKYPGIPRVTSATIDAQTDDKGMLNASLTVKAEK